jgi:hypothetical protein
MKTITLTIPEWDSDDTQASRARVGEALLRALEDVTGAEREVAFSDLVSYLLHAEMLRLSEEEGTPRQFGEARDLLDMALDSFAGDSEDGPYCYEEVEAP